MDCPLIAAGGVVIQAPGNAVRGAEKKVGGGLVSARDQLWVCGF
jgi:hypothetical protein